MKYSQTVITRIITFLHQIKKESGYGYLFILKDFFKLRRRTGITFTEYYRFGMEGKSPAFRDGCLTGKLKTIYLNVLNPPQYRIISADKFIMRSVLIKLHVPMPDFIMCYNPSLGMSTDDLAHDESSVVKILKKKSVEKFVIKPTLGYHGRDVVVFTRVILGVNCLLEKYDGLLVELKKFLGTEPLIFEKHIETTNQLQKINRTSIGTLRIITLLFPDHSVKIVVAFLKIGRHGSCVDNSKGHSNVIAQIDVDSGVIVKVILSGGVRNVIQISHHPDSGESLLGTVIENWPMIIDCVVGYQKVNSFLKAIAWDIALTNSGPVVLETNSFWDIDNQFNLDVIGWKQDVEACYNAWRSK